MRKRLVVITDSLGMPREETTISETWVDKLSQSIYRTYSIQAICRRSLTSQDVADNVQDMVIRQIPDILVLEVGICDCLRRALSKKQLKLIAALNFFPFGFITKHIRQYCSKNHYRRTKTLNQHYVTIEDFRNNLAKIISSARSVVPKCKIIMIAIALPAHKLIEKTYHAYQDAEEYNQVIEQVASEEKVICVNPFRGGIPTIWSYRMAII